MTYNITALQTARTIPDLIVVANDASGQIFIMGLTVAIFVVILLKLKKYAFDKAFLSASWITTILSMLLSFMGLVNFNFVLAFGLIAAVSYAVIVITKS